jgi:hypothetical protein
MSGSYVIICVFSSLQSIRFLLAIVHVDDLNSRAIKISMGWQKTFTLSKRAKGCHLVTEEVASQIQAGLLGVEVSIF